MLIGVDGVTAVITSTASVRRMMTIDALRDSSTRDEVIMRSRRLTFDDARWCLMAHDWPTASDNHRTLKRRSRRMKQ